MGFREGIVRDEILLMIGMFFGKCVRGKGKVSREGSAFDVFMKFV